MTKGTKHVDSDSFEKVNFFFVVVFVYLKKKKKKMNVSEKLFTMTLVCLDELRICPSGFISSLWLFSQQTTAFKRTKKKKKIIHRSTATKGRQPPPCSSLNIIVVDLNSKSSMSFLI